MFYIIGVAGSALGGRIGNRKQRRYGEAASKTFGRGSFR